jgi:hypothetical protein
VTSTVSKIVPHVITSYLTMIVLALVVGCLQGCAEPQQAPATTERHHGFPAQPREAATTSTQAEPQEQPKSPPTGNTAPADNSEPQKEPPFFGSTYWDETLTSVYYYPAQDKDDVSTTHLKFGHREDDIFLCGDQRKSFEPGLRYRLLVTFEPNAPCITNWRVK